jgi:hypothetical protein
MTTSLNVAPLTRVISSAERLHNGIIINAKHDNRVFIAASEMFYYPSGSYTINYQYQRNFQVYRLNVFLTNFPVLIGEII